MKKGQSKSTATSKSYYSQYKDPRWQKMRLEILQRDSFVCQKCKSEDDTLHVHHTVYKKGHKVWEYNPYSLITLCDKCHKDTHERSDRIKKLLSDAEISVRFHDQDAMDKVENFLTAIYISGCDDNNVKAIFTMIDLYWENMERCNEIREDYKQ